MDVYLAISTLRAYPYGLLYTQFSPPMATWVTPPASRKWADEDAPEEDVADDWEAAASESDSASIPKTAPAPKKAPPKKTPIKKNTEIEPEDGSDILDDPVEHRRRELESDLRSAADLVGDSPLALSQFPLNSKNDYESLAAALNALLMPHAHKPYYTVFVQSLLRSLTAPLPSEEVRKCATILSRLANEKQSQEKAAQRSGKKTKAAAKPGLGGLGQGTRAYTEVLDDDFDDFM